MSDPDNANAPSAQVDAAGGSLRLAGDWVLGNAAPLIQALKTVSGQSVQVVDATGVGALDSLGVLELLRYLRRNKLDVAALHVREDHESLVEAIAQVARARPRHVRDYGLVAAVGRIGKAVVEDVHSIVALIAFLGENLVKMLRVVREPARLRLTSVVSHIEQVGLDAAPLVMLLNFLVGAVIAFLGANVLKDFGATIYVVELVSISFLREFAVLLTAILLAGRTASAFTAQIGAMVSGQEVDAMRTIGLDPVEVLVIPRLWALLVALPLLTFLAMIAGLAGGVAVGALSLDIPPTAYLSRMQQTMEFRHFAVGISKAPLFAMVIGLIGCLEGLRVKGTAQSVGEHTTSAVVQAISTVIILDALLAMWFMYMGF